MGTISTLNIKKLTSGKTSEFEVFVKTYQKPVFQICVSVLKDQQLARKAAIMAFKNMYSHIAGAASNSLSDWVHRETYSYAKQFLSEHRIQLRDNSITLTSAEIYDIGEKAFLIDVERDLDGALAVLPDEVRELIYLRDIFAFEYRQIANLTGIAEGVIRSRIDFGRIAVKNALTQKWNT